MPTPKPSSSHGKRLVLVVEDEALQRHMATSIVEDAGFEVVAAADVGEAIQILGTRPDVQIVFTDLDMPTSLEGMELATTVRERWPSIGLIVTSGWNEGRDLTLPPGSKFFPKPYSEAEIVQALRSFG